MRSHHSWASWAGRALTGRLAFLLAGLIDLALYAGMWVVKSARRRLEVSTMRRR